MSDNDSIQLDRLPSGERTPESLQVAVIATLLEAAHASGEISAEELGKLSSGIFTLFGLSDAEIGHLIEVSEVLRADSNKRGELLSQVGESFSLQQRQELLSIVWRILIVDGKVDTEEAQVAVEIRKALNLSMEAAVAARIRAEQNEIALLVESLKKAKESSAEEEGDEETE